MRWLLLLPVLFLLIVPSALADQVFDIRLSRNTSAGSVTLPTASGAPTTIANQTITTPPYALIHVLNNTVAALVFSQETPHSLTYNQSSGMLSLGLRQNISGSQAFLVFAKGDAQTIQNRIPEIQQRHFLQWALPGFSGPSSANRIMLRLSYPDIAFAKPLTLVGGFATIEVANSGTMNGAVQLNISQLPG